MTSVVRRTASYSITQRRHSDRNGNLIKGLANPLLFLDKRGLRSFSSLQLVKANASTVTIKKKKKKIFAPTLSCAMQHRIRLATNYLQEHSATVSLRVVVLVDQERALLPQCVDIRVWKFLPRRSAGGGAAWRPTLLPKQLKTFFFSPPPNSLQTVNSSPA